MLFAPVLGTGPVADAFFVAFRLPNLFRRLFAEGAFNASFVPLFARHLELDGRPAARLFAEQSLAVLLATLLVVTALAMAAMPWLMYLLAPGFAKTPEKFELAVHLSRITFPYLLFMALVALLSGVLNSLYKFAAAAAAPIVLNVCFVVAMVVVLPFTGAPGELLAWTVVAAGIGQFLLLLTACRRAGIVLHLPRPRLSAEVKRLLALMLPGMISAGALQINLMVGTIIATLQAGAVSFLYYADRIYQLPLGLIGIAFAVVLLPDLARKLRSGAVAQAMYSFNRGLELALLLTLPAAAALLVIPEPIIIVLFERGAFDRADTEATAWALAAFAFGLPAFVLIKVLQPAFFAREDTVTPLRMALATVTANVVLAVLLFWPLHHVGLALATALAAWLNLILLGIALHRRGFLGLDARFKRRLSRIVAASALLGLALFTAMEELRSWFDAAAPVRILGLAILVGGGLILYAGLALALGAVKRAELGALIRRRPVAGADLATDRGP
jgi:putative peptidoglycan lipid II flippase